MDAQSVVERIRHDNLGLPPALGRPDARCRRGFGRPGEFDRGKSRPGFCERFGKKGLWPDALGGTLDANDIEIVAA